MDVVTAIWAILNVLQASFQLLILLFVAYFLMRGMIGVRRARLGSQRYASVDELARDVIERTGLVETKATPARRLDRLVIDGRDQATNRKVRLRFCADAFGTGRAQLTLDADTLISASLRRRRATDFGSKARFGSFVLLSRDVERARRFFNGSFAALAAVENLFSVHGADRVTLVDGKLVVDVPLATLEPGDYRPLLDAAKELLAVIEPRRLPIRVLRGERRALTIGGTARCSYCHGELLGTEPDLVACSSCSTILHEGCWNEHGRCLGCRGTAPERPSVTV